MSDDESVCRTPEEDFRDAVKEWVAIEDQLTDIRKIVSEKNKRKRKLAETICFFMKQHDKLVCNLSAGGALEMKERKTSVALKKEHVEILLTQFLQDSQSAKEGAEYIFQNKEVRHTHFLKRLGQTE